MDVPRRNLSAAYSALPSFYSRERTANYRADDLWFDNCFRTRKPLALHWTGTGLLYFFFLFSAFDYKKNVLYFGKQLRVQELLVSSPAASASCLCQRLSGNPSLFWANFAGSCCPQGPHRHSLVAVPPWLSTSNSPSLTWKMLQTAPHQPPLLHTTNLWGMALFLKENLVIFHWHFTPEQSFCPRGGSQHIKINKFYPQINSLSCLSCDTDR